MRIPLHRQAVANVSFTSHMHKTHKAFILYAYRIAFDDR